MFKGRTVVSSCPPLIPRRAHRTSGRTGHLAEAANIPADAIMTCGLASNPELKSRITPGVSFRRGTIFKNLPRHQSRLPVGGERLAP